MSHNPFIYLYNSFKTERLKLYKGLALTFPASFIPTAIYIGTYEYLMGKMSQLVDKYTDRK